MKLGTDNQSMQSGAGKVSCNNTALSRCTIITVWTVVHTVLTAMSQSNGNGQTLTTLLLLLLP